MPQAKGRGRPKTQTGGIDRSAIIACAKAILQTEGLERLTFRALAAALGVTAMAVKYHVGSREELLRDLAADAFKGLDASVPAGTQSAELRQYLLRYCRRALRNVGLVRFMLSDPKHLPKVLCDYTAQVRLRTQAINDGDRNDVLLNLLIDYIHGFVFAADAAPSEISPAVKDCMKSIDWLIDALESRGSSAP